jgi:hypothetical protein
VAVCFILGLNDGARLGDVEIEQVDDVTELMLNDAAFELHGEGERAIIEREIVCEDSESLDGFVLREMNGQALNFGIEQFANGGMRSHLFVRFARNSLLGDFRSDRGRVWHD